MELRITNKINREVNKLKWRWDWYMVKLSLWKIRFNLDTMHIRVKFHPNVIKVKIKGKLNRIGWKLYRLRIEFRYLMRRIKCVWNRLSRKYFK